MLHQNLVLKIAALILAIFLWFYVLFREQIIQKSLAVPLELRLVSSEVVPVEESPKIYVTLQGRKSEIESLKNGQVSAYVNLKGLKAGRHSLAVHPVLLGNLLRLVKFGPKQITLDLEPVVNKSLPLEVTFVGTMRTDYLLGEPRVTPAWVRITGPQSTISRVNRVVVTVDRSSRNLGQPQSLFAKAVDAQSNEIKGVSIVPNQITVQMSIERILASRQVPVKVDTAGSLAAGYEISSVSAYPKVVTIAGDRGRLHDIEVIHTAPVPLADATSDISKVVPLIIPTGITALETGQVKVEIKVTKG